MKTTIKIFLFAASRMFWLPPDVEAVVGRPVTPASVAGTTRRVARRTTRRVVARTAPVKTTVVVVGTTYTVLPVGYTRVVVGGATYYRYGGVYYKPYYQGSTVTYVVVNKPL